jgi:hypothetical protein
MSSQIKSCTRRILLIGLIGVVMVSAGTGSTVEPEPSHISFPNMVRSANYTFRIPFTWVGRLPAVTAKIDTVEGIFFFDTGAERLLLNNRFFQGDRRVTGTMQYGVTGGSNEVYKKQVDTLKWENLFLFDVEANVLSLGHLERARNVSVVGIIGYDVFKDYEVLLDYPNKLIVLTKLDKKGNRLDSRAFLEEPVDSIDISMGRHGIIVKARVEGKTLRMNLDSGAEINMLDRLAPKKVFRRFNALKRVNMLGTGNQTVEVLAGTLSGVETDKTDSGVMRTLLTNLDDLNRILGTRVDGVLGYEYLSKRRTLINYKKKKLFFFNVEKQ